MITVRNLYNDPSERRWPIVALNDIIVGDAREVLLHCSFPSPAADYEKERIDLKKALVPNPDYSEIVQAYGDCCIDRGILDGSYVVVDFSELPRNNDIVLVRDLDGDTARVYCVENDGVFLRAANHRKRYPPLRIDESTEIRGVVVLILTSPRKSKG